MDIDVRGIALQLIEELNASLEKHQAVREGVALLYERIREAAAADVVDSPASETDEQEARAEQHS